LGLFAFLRYFISKAHSLLSIAVPKIFDYAGVKSIKQPVSCLITRLTQGAKAPTMAAQLCCACPIRTQTKVPQRQWYCQGNLVGE